MAKGHAFSQGYGKEKVGMGALRETYRFRDRCLYRDWDHKGVGDCHYSPFSWSSVFPLPSLLRHYQESVEDQFSNF